MIDTPCVLWQGHIDKWGYGKTYASPPSGGAKRSLLAHRLAYERAKGPIPEKLTVDHLCFTRSCVNPEHLRLLSKSENSANQRKATKTHCKQGHEFTPENTTRNKRGHRQCRTCHAFYGRRRRAMERVASAPEPSPEEQAEIDRFGIFDSEDAIRQERRRWVEWLAEIGYGLDFTHHPHPPCTPREVAEVYAEREPIAACDLDTDAGETSTEVHEWVIAQNTGWGK